jgi:hypothetical protein
MKPEIIIEEEIMENSVYGEKYMRCPINEREKLVLFNLKDKPYRQRDEDWLGYCEVCGEDHLYLECFDIQEAQG